MRRGRKHRTRALALVAGIIAAAALGGCGPAPRASSATPPAVPGASGPNGTGAPGDSANPASLGAALAAAISTDDVVNDLTRLDAIATANGGNRAAGSPGFDASASFVADELRSAGYGVTLDPVAMTVFRQEAPTVLEVLGPVATSFQDAHDLKAMLLSPSGDVTGPLVALGFDPNVQPGARTGLGCAPGDWSEVPAGAIALVQPGNCRRHDAIVNAQEAGVAAVITSYVDWAPDHVLRPTLVTPEDITVPAIGVTGATGVALFAAAQAGARVHVATHTAVVQTTSSSVIAETKGGDTSHVVMIGGHLDSVIDGPGVNDDGSGTMAILEMARELARLRPDGAPWKVRFAFWTGEELGLFGSFHYVGGLGDDEVRKLEAYLNLDMIGSPNSFRQVYDMSGGSRPAAAGVLAARLEQALRDAGLSAEPANIGGSSDHVAFDQAGVPVGGLFSGANEIVSADEAVLFGATAGAAADACYHLACDTIANVDRAPLEQLARAAAEVLGNLAEGATALPPG